MNDWLTSSKSKPKSQKMLYIGIIVSVIVICVGYGIDKTNVFGKDGTEIIKMTVSMLAGMIIGITFISSNKGMKIKELLS